MSLVEVVIKWWCVRCVSYSSSVVFSVSFFSLFCNMLEISGNFSVSSSSEDRLSCVWGGWEPLHAVTTPRFVLRRFLTREGISSRDGDGCYDDDDETDDDDDSR